MGKINGYIKGLFIFFNMKIAFVGSVLVYGLVKIKDFRDQLEAAGIPILNWVLVFAIGIYAIATLGVYAGRSEDVRALKIFAGFMVAGIIVMLSFGFIIDGKTNEFSCCGLVSTNDWGDDIPTTCECNPQRGYDCIPSQGTSGPSFIYKQTCGDHIFEWIDLFSKIAKGVCFGFAVTALLGLLMSLLMILLVKCNDNSEGDMETHHPFCSSTAL